jgi:NitT/TauT family transport system permease protein
LSGQRKNLTPVHSIARLAETEMLRLLSFTVFLATWWGAALLVGEEKLPPPPIVLATIVTEASSGALFSNLGVTLARVALAFTLAMSLGAAIGYLMGRVRLADRLGDPWLILLLNLPALVVIVLAYIWAGLTEVAAITAIAINKLPIAVVTVREGTRALDAALDEMATVNQYRPGGRSGMSYCRNWRPTLRPRRDPAFLWSGRSSWLPNCSDARVASVSRSASRSSCSTSLVSSPIR